MAGVEADAFLAAAEYHGVGPLVAERLLDAGVDLPAALVSRLRDLTRHAAATNLVRERELRDVIAAMTHAGVDALLMKGAQLAYTHYPRPDLRPRVDTDVLIPVASRQMVGNLLVGLGYAPPTHVSGALVMSQAMYVKRVDDVVVHEVDVHWRIANPQVFAGYLEHGELARTAVGVPALGPAARGLSDLHALLVACVHRVAHHYDSDCLIWLYDIHLIASRLAPEQWPELRALAEARGVLAICVQGLARSMRLFGTNIPPAILAVDATPGRREVTAAYLKPARRHVAHVVTDLRALRSWADRWRLVREHLVPSPRYMRDVYAPASTAPLPLLYALRAVRGARKWLFRSV